MSTKQYRTGPNPNAWIVGPDPVRHEKFVCWQRMRAQAHYRGEKYQLTFEDFESVWADQWHRRGRHSEDLCITRKNPKLPWKLNNVQLMSRAEHVRTTHSRKTR
jgi:hypothetical protein